MEILDAGRALKRSDADIHRLFLHTTTCSGKPYARTPLVDGNGLSTVIFGHGGAPLVASFKGVLRF